jgi:hypothetical protein
MLYPMLRWCTGTQIAIAAAAWGARRARRGCDLELGGCAGALRRVGSRQRRHSAAFVFLYLAVLH